MPGFNGLGTYVRYYSWVADSQNPATDFIRADKMDTEMNGFATGLSNCVTRDGQGVPLANLPMGDFKLTGLAAGSAPGDSVNFSQVFSNPSFSLATLASPTITGVLSGAGATQMTAPTPAPGDDSNNIATTAFVNSAVFSLVVPPWFQQFAYQQNGII